MKAWKPDDKETGWRVLDTRPERDHLASVTKARWSPFTRAIAALKPGQCLQVDLGHCGMEQKRLASKVSDRRRAAARAGWKWTYGWYIDVDGHFVVTCVSTDDEGAGDG